VTFPSPLTPLVIVAAWVAAGQWSLAGDNVRAWVLLAAALAAAILLPLPGQHSTAGGSVRTAAWLGWAALFGLIAGA
jgi:hypothetical protein